VKRTAFIQTILHEAADLTLSGSSVKLIDAIANDLWPVEVDTTQMSQALQSVFSNAKEAMPNGGPLLVRAENVQVATEQNVALKPGKYVKITIQDHGVGIPSDNLAKIFDPYFSTKPHNSGLGLTTAYSIITRHDGHITVESELKVGATFYIYLPASENVITESTHDLDPTKPAAGKGRVLIMDDEELIREATGALLEFLGYDFQAAKDGAEAITLYREALAGSQRFDVVILDLTVPGGMGGHESLKQLLAIDPRVKAIVSSGYFHDPVIANYRAHGFQGVVSKPYTIEELSDTLYKLIYLDS
jgi:CheY-like chemotaxis protein